MRSLSAFIQVTLDGYFADVTGDISWAHGGNDDPEWNDFVADNAAGGGVLVFGRITYEMMASYWPTPAAKENDPRVAEGMNDLPKVVFSKTLKKAAWKNTKVLKGDLATEIRKLKKDSGKDLVILGSGSIVAQLAQEGLIDEYQLVVYPIVLGRGRKLFDIKERLALKLKNTRTFGNGNVLLCYQPAAAAG